jgi:RNA polymerase sigma-70 factor (ECF subfamily)
MSTAALSPAPDELDELTVRRAQRGDEDACRALVERYQRPVFALLGRMVGTRDPGRVEDLAQETFLHVFRALSRFSPLGPARLSTWILTIAARRAVDSLRKQALATEPLDRAGDVSGGARADELAIRNAIGAIVAREVASLAPEYRAAFLLREYHDMSYAEIARALDIDLGTVKSRLGRARAALREALREVRDE